MITVATGTILQYVCPDGHCFKILTPEQYERFKNGLCPKCRNHLVKDFKQVIEWRK